MRCEISYINHDDTILDRFLKSQLSLSNLSLGQHQSFAKKCLKNFIKILFCNSKFFYKTLTAKGFACYRPDAKLAAYLGISFRDKVSAVKTFLYFEMGHSTIFSIAAS